MSKAVVVFSGGQDSTTCLIQALTQYDEVHCVTFDYGQRHRQEIEIAQTLSAQLGASSHKVLDVGILNYLTVSALTRDIPIEENKDGNAIPNTFVPGRNILFLTLAGIFAYQIEADVIITGVCETDFSGYPDCRDEFIKSMQTALVQGMDKPLSISTPLMWLDKAQTWALADKYNSLDLVRHHTLTCYNGLKGDGCGTCPACLLRQRGLNEYLASPEAIQAQLASKCSV